MVYCDWDHWHVWLKWRVMKGKSHGLRMILCCSRQTKYKYEPVWLAQDPCSVSLIRRYSKHTKSINTESWSCGTHRYRLGNGEIVMCAAGDVKTVSSKILLGSLVTQALMIREVTVDPWFQLHIDFGVPFLYSVLKVRHIFGLQKAHVAFNLAATVLFLRLIMHLNPLKIQDL